MSEEVGSPQPLNVYDVVSIMLEQMASIAWQKMGLHPDPITGQLSNDFVQAKVAVDAAAYLGSLLTPELDEEDRRRIQNLLTDLKVNFVQRSQEVQN